MPEVSVIMPVYNIADLSVLQAAVDSIRDQTCQDWELIICDDGSTDNTAQAIKQMIENDARIHFIQNKKNRGAGHARNACIRAACGKYIAVMDADDISKPRRLEKQAAFLESHPEYALVGCNALLIDSHGAWGERRLEEKPVKESFLSTLPFVHPSIMMRREVAWKLHGYAQTPQTRRVEDYDLLMRLYASGYRGYNIQETLFCYREDLDSYKKRKYGYRIDECRVRFARFRDMGILRGNLRYVLKPLAVGMIPRCIMRKLRERRYGKRGKQRKPQEKSKGSLGNINMDKIKIFVTHTPNTSQALVQNPLFCHVAAGSDFQTGPLPEGMLADNTGENISYKNKAYCELTTQYWAWKNVQADYYGFSHYRRYFSFAPGMLPEADCGCIVCSHINGKMENMLCLHEEDIRRKVGQYDFLIAKGIPVRALWAKNVYEHYRKAPGLKIRDYALFLQILCEKYPHLRNAARAYSSGKVFYPCNMFIMKKELFAEYAGMLFAVLEEFEKRSDMRMYSREGYRTPGHLGERFAGIYYSYLKQKGGYRLGELQMAMVSHAGAEGYVEPLAGEIPIVLAADREYVPILFTCLKSLAGCTDARRDYHIYIFHTDIGAEDMQTFREGLACRNIKIDFVDVGARVAGYRLKAKEHITEETFYRFLVLDILKNCPKAVYLDSDMVIRRDIAGLYGLPLGDCLLAAARDPDFIGQYNGANPDTRHYCDNVLKLKNPYRYVQAGVLVLNVQGLRRETDVEQLFRMAEDGDYRYSDQDILNIVCAGRVKKLDMAWNVLTDSRQRHSMIQSAPAAVLEEYEQARQDPYIIHYAGDSKPWKNPAGDFAEEFWKIARQTPYYEELLCRMKMQDAKSTLAEKMLGILKQAAKKTLPQGSRIRHAVGRLYWRLK